MPPRNTIPRAPHVKNMPFRNSCLVDEMERIITALIRSGSTLCGRFSRRQLTVVLLATLGCLGPQAITVSAQQTHIQETTKGVAPFSQQLPTLQQELEFGLRARRPNEFAFIQRVVSLVNRGDLPLVMVKSTFVWSRRKSPYFPFPYFERGLRLRARQIGVVI